MSDSSTVNDEAIARALEREEQEQADGLFARRIQQGNGGVPSGGGDSSHGATTIVQGQPLNCPGYHGLNEFLVSYAQRVVCNACQRTLHRDERAYSCVVCNYDVCSRCYLGNGARGSNNGNRRQQPVVYPPQQAALGGNDLPPSSHMCVVPCVIGSGSSSICVEMMIDTGAQTSVMSLALAKELGLSNRINSMYRGVANGVGQARICGKIRNVVVEFTGSHVEFPMDFMVLDVPERMLLLGLDLMRRYQCIVNLQKEVLIFGGEGGVEVPMLPADEHHRSMFRNNPLLEGLLPNGGCPTM